MSAMLLKEAYVYMATTTDTEFILDEGKYRITRMRLSQAAEQHIRKYGICVKIGCTTGHPSQRAYNLEGEKGVVMVKIQTLQTTQSGLLLIESILRKQLESHPMTRQIGTDTFQVFTDENREAVIAKWDEWIANALRISNLL